MRTPIFMAGLTALATSAALLVACGDDDSKITTNTQNEPTSPDGEKPGTEPGTTPTDREKPTEPAAEAPARITPRSTTRIANAINPYGLVFASDGMLYASGATMDGDVQKLAVWRFKDGVLDTTFGNAGVLTTDIPGSENSFDIVEVSPGNFVVHAVAGGKIWLVKLTKTGDTFSFGTPVAVPFAWSDDDLTGWPGANPPAYNS
ncbi:MAG TPA: hypothetical protein VM580_21335, partial [Labilithrix sp.]|nr:hypothetical protein [Labilithrix sp.]